MKLDKIKLLELNKTFNQLSPKLRRYIKRKLHLGTKNGVFSKNFYSVDGVLDDIYLMSFEELEKGADTFNPKISLLKNTIEKLNGIFKKEGLFSSKNKIGISALLKEELKTMKEEFTTDGNGHLIPFEELEDISYHLDDDKEKIQLIDDDTAVPTTGEDEPGDEMLMSESYENLGVVSKAIFELSVLADVSSLDISETFGIDNRVVQSMIKVIKMKLVSS